jgi:hypothetical protein
MAVGDCEPGALISLFPLTGSLLLPGTFLPLNVFEPRYRRLVSDTLEGDRRIGMIQPRLPGHDNTGWHPGDPERPELYPVGCLGELVECEPQPDGRFLIVLAGVKRFRVVRELDEQCAYRRAVADAEEFDADLSEPARRIDVAELLAAVDRYRRRHELSFDMDVLAALAGARLVNALSVALPFTPPEKQALLEAPTPHARRDVLLDLMAMGVEQTLQADPYAPPTVH